MKYDFTTVYDRRGMDALAVDALGQPGEKVQLKRQVVVGYLGQA